MTTIAKDELAAMIAALESQPHLSLKEEKYLAIMKELSDYRENDEYVILPDNIDTAAKFREWVMKQ